MVVLLASRPFSYNFHLLMRATHERLLYATLLRLLQVNLWVRCSILRPRLGAFTQPPVRAKIQLVHRCPLGEGIYH